MTHRKEQFTEGTLVAHRSCMYRNNMGFGVVVAYHPDSYPHEYEVLFPKIEKRYYMKRTELITMPKKSMRADWSERRKK